MVLKAEKTVPQRLGRQVVDDYRTEKLSSVAVPLLAQHLLGMFSTAGN